MIDIKYFIGPMSKNVVDACIEFSIESGHSIGFIPSRRQVEHDGGYVNNWTTAEFNAHIKRSNIETILTRDHGGPGQGTDDDDGYISLSEDCRHLDMIHVDPWKKYSDFDSGTRWTIDMIRFCYEKNPSMFYEVGTEQSIRKFSTAELNALLKTLQRELSAPQYKQIKYCVIQSGTSLKESINTGLYDEERLSSMIDIVKKYELRTKEHNGDYLPPTLIKQKMDLGLDSINIAPEFGQIETRTYVQKIKEEKPELIDFLWQICYNSKRWEKWVDKSFQPFKQKEELINICGHYVFSNDDFVSGIRSHFVGIDTDIKNNIKKKLEELHSG